MRDHRGIGQCRQEEGAQGHKGTWPATCLGASSATLMRAGRLLGLGVEESAHDGPRELSGAGQGGPQGILARQWRGGWREAPL